MGLVFDDATHLVNTFKSQSLILITWFLKEEFELEAFVIKKKKGVKIKTLDVKK